MAYRNKTFVSFASEDIHAYRLMTAWKKNKSIDFNFFDAHDLNTARDTSLPETIKRRLRERLSNAKQIVLLIGEETREKAEINTSFIHYEVSVMEKLGLPIVFANLNKSKRARSSKIPRRLLDLYTMSVPFSPTAIKYALDNFPDEFRRNTARKVGEKKRGRYHYKDYVYDDMGT